MNTTTFSTARHQATAFALALTLTLGMLLGVNGLATQGGADAQMAAAAAAAVQTAAAASQSLRGV